MTRFIRQSPALDMKSQDRSLDCQISRVRFRHQLLRPRPSRKTVLSIPTRAPSFSVMSGPQVKRVLGLNRRRVLGSGSLANIVPTFFEPEENK